MGELSLMTVKYRSKYRSPPDSSVGRESACSAGDPGLIPGSGSSPGEGIGYSDHYSWASLVSQTVKNLPAMWETRVWVLDWEDPLEEGMGKHSSILALELPWTEEPGRLQSMGLQRVGHNWETSLSFTLGTRSALMFLAYKTTHVAKQSFNSHDWQN